MNVFDVLREKVKERYEKINPYVSKNVIEIVNQVEQEYNNDFCEWRLCDEEANVYDTTCRNPHILLEGSSIDNRYEFCPYCGKKIKVVNT